MSAAAPTATDLELLARFEDGSLPKEEFKHLAHVRVAWTLLALAPLPEALARFSAALKRLAAGYGVPELYSETITVFYMLVIHARRRDAAALGFEDFRAANPDLFEPMPKFVGACYPPGALDDPASKASFRMPLRWPSC
jgi:hypothetical protein